MTVHSSELVNSADVLLQWRTFSVGEDEVVESDLTAQQFVHVHFVCVECAEQDLQKKKKNQN